MIGFVIVFKLMTEMQFFWLKRSKKFDCKPGINEHAMELHVIARKCFVSRKKSDKPKNTINPFLEIW